MDAEKLVLDLCGGSGNWSRPYAQAGYIVELIDPRSGGADVRLLESGRIHARGVLAAPPCTVFASSGARWPRSDEDMREGLSIVDACLRIAWAVTPKWWALENPIGKLVRYLGRPTLYFDPCDYGDAYTKRTCLWGTFTTPTKKPVAPRARSPIHYMSPGPHRAAQRSLTPPGFARAFFEANP